jgi:hypothetical protein
MGLFAVTILIAAIVVDQGRLYRWVPRTLNRLRRRPPR